MMWRRGMATLLWAALCLGGCGSTTRVPIRDRVYREFIFEYAEQVEVASDPAGARVWLDGDEVGTTPCTVTVSYGPVWANQLGFRDAMSVRRLHRNVERTEEPVRIGFTRFGTRMEERVISESVGAEIRREEFGPTTWIDTMSYRFPPEQDIRVQGPAGVKHIRLQASDTLFQAMEAVDIVGENAATPRRVTGERRVFCEWRSNKNSQRP